MTGVNGIAWANQFKAPSFNPWGKTQGGMPLQPSLGGYGSVPNMPYMPAPHPTIRPAGMGPIEMGSQGMDRAFFLACPYGGAGRNPYGDTGRQGRSRRTFRVGSPAFSATVVMY